MSDDTGLDGLLEAQERRRAERRDFLRYAGGFTVAAAGAALVGACGGGDDDGGTATPTPTPTPTTSASSGVSDADLLNFLLHIEYLQAQFYALATTGTGLAADLITGTGTAGAVSGGAKVTFTDAVVGQMAAEIAQDQLAHVQFMRGALGTAAVAQPAIDLSVSATSAFSTIARAAGIIGTGESFNPYANDANFLLAAFLLEDLGVSAYRGTATLLSSSTLLQVVSGLMSVEGYHAAMIRTTLYTKGAADPTLITRADGLSNARDSYDGSADLDQGISDVGDASNIVPANADGLVLGRSPQQTLNVLFTNAAAADKGGFFPSGVNGSIKTSIAN
ncbi:ferritin-like domain-containing protein [Sphingomonas sp. PL-96]|uniref:ferritin-like domain-containing protein n=1 Tax=Sphingomonas sp. PL-96 TaxID=2887201 RepID=UPI001E40D390|nr:ferritin-like domain-containing protein [Sphingomonas sp. PL-96]MCC2976486.1 ferritin-like domain-containing protein [Sphingomonas sp. PL-96]